MTGPHLFAIPGREPDPFAFCGGPWPLIESLREGDEVTAAYVVHECRRAEARNGKPYLRLLLGDRSGTIQAMVWDDAERLEAVCAAESVVGVRARVGSYQDQPQLTVLSVEPLRAGPGDLERLFPASPRPRESMERELEALVSSVSDPALRKLLRRCLGKGTELGRSYRVHPAAKRMHHAYLGGLLEHSLSVATACGRLAEHYRSAGLPLDRDLLVTGAPLHDLAKVRELKGFPSIGYTTEGQLLGHIVIGIQLVGREAASVPELPAERLLLLQHLIASHQGKPEWDSPKVPQVLEALVLHYADDLDAKLNQAGSLLSGVESGGWSAYDRGMARSFFQPPRSFPTAPEVEPVAAEEAVDLLMDLFRG